MTKSTEPEPELPEVDAAERAEEAVAAVTEKLAAVAVAPTGA